MQLIQLINSKNCRSALPRDSYCIWVLAELLYVYFLFHCNVEKMCTQNFKFNKTNNLCFLIRTFLSETGT